jgi:glycosyltransferase involved in cell wall biosynthesis
MAFCIRRNRSDELKPVAAEHQLDVWFPGFARTEELAGRTAAADVLVVSFNREWTGAVVPAKFFGALAAGRPVLCCRSAESALAHGTGEFRVGWMLHDGNARSIADQLLAYAASPARQKEMQERCFRTYHAHFSRRIQIGKWNRIVRSVLSDQPMEQPASVEESSADIEEESLAASIPSPER